MSNIVTFQQAEKLKEIGYNRNVLHYYDSKGELYEGFHCDNEDKVKTSDIEFDYNHDRAYHIDAECSAPSVSEALDYLREEKGCYCGVYPFMWGYKGMAIIQDKYSPCTIEVEPLATYPESESALLTAALEYLEKEGGEG